MNNKEIFNKIVGKTIKLNDYNADNDYSDISIDFTDGSSLVIDTGLNQSDMSFEYIENKNEKKDESDKNMSKELNIIEASNMFNTDFKVIYQNGEEHGSIVHINELGNPVNIKNGELEHAFVSFINAKFIPMQKPVTFIEAYNSKKKVKVNHDLIKYSYDPEIIAIRDSYHSIDETLYKLIEKFGENNFRDIIDNSKWYIDEE